MDSADRISEVPPDITNHILQFLTVKEAAQTSILSTQWRYKWKLSPKLILDSHFFRSVIQLFDNQHIHVSSKRFVSNKHGGYLDGRINEYSKIVNNILFSRDTPIHEFELCIPRWLPHKQGVTYWLRSLSTKSVHELSLLNNSYDRKLPTWMFSCVGFANLTHLTLVNWTVPSLSTTCTGFACLITLALHNSCANTVGILVSKCPLLQNLSLNINDTKGWLNIGSPRLQSLTVQGSVYGVLLKETQSIKKLYLVCQLNHKWDDQIMELLNCIPLLEDLILGYDFCSALGMTIGGDCCFEHLKKAFIHINGNELELIKLILSSSPLLQKYPDNLARAAELAVSSLQAVLQRTINDYKSAGFDPKTSSLEIRLIQSQEDIRNPKINFTAQRFK